MSCDATFAQDFGQPSLRAAILDKIIVLIKKNPLKDSLIAYSWKKYMEENGENPERLVLMPMVKASVLAFNATSQVVQGDQNYSFIESLNSN